MTDACLSLALVTVVALGHKNEEQQEDDLSGRFQDSPVHLGALVTDAVQRVDHVVHAQEEHAHRL